MKLTQIAILLWVGSAVGAAIWFGFFQDVHGFRRKLSQEDRRNQAVGAVPLPTGKIQLEFAPNSAGCVSISHAEIDGAQVVVYWQFSCLGSRNAFVQIFWKALSPDGTIVTQDHEYVLSGSQIEQGDKGEFRFKIREDPRMVKIKLGMEYQGFK